LEKEEIYDYLAKEKEKRKRREKEEQEEEKKKELANKKQINGDQSETTENEEASIKGQNLDDNSEEKINSNIENLENKDKFDKDISIIDECSEVLLGFEKLNIKIHFLSGNIESIFKKKKYLNYFDFVFLGLPSKNILNNIVNIGKKNMKLLIELNSYMTVFNEKNKEEFKENLKNLTRESDYILEDTNCKYVWKFIHKPNINITQSDSLVSTQAEFSSLAVKDS
jgi:hypothetical protein